MPVEKKAYIQLTDLLGVPWNDFKDAQLTTIKVFGIEIDISCFIIRLPKEKLDKTTRATVISLSQKFVSFIDIQSLVTFLLFCSQAVRLGRIFMRRLWDFINYFPRTGPKTTIKRIPAWVRKDLEWQNKLLPAYNGICFLI